MLENQIIPQNTTPIIELRDPHDFHFEPPAVQ
jgi:hypothetical protein